MTTKDTNTAAGGSQLVRGVRPASEASGIVEDMAHRMCWRYKHSSDPAHSHTYTFNRHTLLEFANALLDLQRKHVQDAEARAIAAEYAEGQRVLAERERCDSLRARLLEMEAVHEDLSGQILEAVDAERERLRVLVEAVRDANAAEANGDYQFRVLTERQERAWLALMAGLEAPNGRGKLETTA